jgi:hypothetical protein
MSTPGNTIVGTDVNNEAKTIALKLANDATSIITAGSPVEIFNTFIATTRRGSIIANTPKREASHEPARAIVTTGSSETPCEAIRIYLFNPTNRILRKHAYLMTDADSHFLALMLGSSPHMAAPT